MFGDSPQQRDGIGKLGRLRSRHRLQPCHDGLRDVLGWQPRVELQSMSHSESLSGLYTEPAKCVAAESACLPPLAIGSFETLSPAEAAYDDPSDLCAGNQAWAERDAATG